MTDYALWRRGINGPEFVVLRDEPKMVEYDRRHKIGQPVPIAKGLDGLSLAELRDLYPCPPERDE